MLKKWCKGDEVEFGISIISRKFEMVIYHLTYNSLVTLVLFSNSNTATVYKQKSAHNIVTTINIFP